MTNILIATPTSAETTKSHYTSSLAATLLNLAAHGVRTQYATANYPLIPQSRDVFAHTFLQGDWTHLLCIDSDMEPAADLAWKMLSLNLPFVGAMYTKREISLENVIKAAREGKADPLAFGFKFAYRPLPGATIKIQDNDVCEIEAIGFGFVLLKRECLATIAPTTPRYFSTALGAELAGFFQTIGDDPEDYSFCHRWRKVGGKVMAYAEADIRHIGGFRYGIPFNRAAKAGAL